MDPGPKNVGPDDSNDSSQSPPSRRGKMELIGAGKRMAPAGSGVGKRRNNILRRRGSGEPGLRLVRMRR